MVYFFSFSASYITFIFKPFDMVSHLNWINLSFIYISVLWPLQFFGHFFHYSVTSTWNCLWHSLCSILCICWMNESKALTSLTYIPGFCNLTQTTLKIKIHEPSMQKFLLNFFELLWIGSMQKPTLNKF